MLSRRAAVYLAQRLILVLLTTLVVSSAVFIGIHLLPGSPFVTTQRRSPQTVAMLNRVYHLNLPLVQQYRIFLTGLLHGNLGQSLIYRGEEITPLLVREATVSAEIGAVAVLFTVIIGGALGTVAALRQNSWVDYLATSTAVVGYSVPNFVTASVFVIVLGVWLYNLTGGAAYYAIGWQGVYGTLPQVAIPAFALGFPFASIVARLTRASLVEALHQDYIRTARAKGVSRRAIVLRHGLRNALIPVLSIMGTLALGLITGSVVVENIFGIPGLGHQFITSITNHDYNIVIAVFTLFAALVGLANLTVDILYTVVDPRIRF